MHSIIAPSFFSKKICVLPGIGKLTLVTHPAQADFANEQIEAPKQEIVFTPGAQNDYLFNEFSAISDLIKRKLDEQGKVELLGIGTFTKTDDNAFVFDACNIDEELLMPVTAKRVIRENAAHSMLVGDRETTSTAMAELLNEEETSDSGNGKFKWWFWAIALAAVSLLLIAFYLYQNGLNNFSCNQPF